jgi:hypothetical protein
MKHILHALDNYTFVFTPLWSGLYFRCDIFWILSKGFANLHVLPFLQLDVFDSTIASREVLLLTCLVFCDIIKLFLVHVFKP